MGQNICQDIQHRQQNQLEQVQDLQHKRKYRQQIYATHKNMQECSIPKCKCKLLHPYDQKKICELCQKYPPPFINNTHGPKYIKTDVSLMDPLPQTINIAKQSKHVIAQKIPTSIGYFNAWSLPTSKYYVNGGGSTFKIQDLSKKELEVVVHQNLMNDLRNQRVEQTVLFDPVGVNNMLGNQRQSFMGEGDYRRKNQNLNIY